MRPRQQKSTTKIAEAAAGKERAPTGEFFLFVGVEAGAGVGVGTGAGVVVGGALAVRTVVVAGDDIVRSWRGKLSRVCFLVEVWPRLEIVRALTSGGRKTVKPGKHLRFLAEIHCDCGAAFYSVSIFYTSLHCLFSLPRHTLPTHWLMAPVYSMIAFSDTSPEGLVSANPFFMRRQNSNQNLFTVYCHYFYY